VKDQHSSHRIQSEYSPSLHGTGVGGHGHIGWVIPGSGLWKWSGAGGVDRLLQLLPGPAYAPNKSEYGEPVRIKPSQTFMMSNIIILITKSMPCTRRGHIIKLHIQL